MNPQQSHHLKPGTPVWVWIVQLARGRWWPGTVEALRTIDDRLRLSVRFECRRANDPDKAPVMVGMTTTAMRYLELRNLEARGFDKPHYTPVSLLERPEEEKALLHPVAEQPSASARDVMEHPSRQLANGNYNRN